jgi:hypothetical protein
MLGIFNNNVQGITKNLASMVAKLRSLEESLTNDIKARNDIINALTDENTESEMEAAKARKVAANIEKLVQGT